MWVIFYSRWEWVILFYPDTAQNWILLKIVFWKWKLLKQERFLNIVSSNLNVAIGQALQEITIHDLKELCVATGCLNVQWILFIWCSRGKSNFDWLTRYLQNFREAVRWQKIINRSHLCAVHLHCAQQTTHISQDDRKSIIALCDLCPKTHVFMFSL